MAKSTEVATAKSTAVSTEVSAFEQFAGAGTENVNSTDVLIPRLAILQDLSPQVKKNKPEFIEGAEPGDICDVGTGDLFGQEVIFLPVYYKKEWLEWAPRATGKGLIAIHPTDEILTECTKDEKGRFITAEGNLVQETAQWYGFNLTAKRRRCFIPMASSQLKRSRKWMTMVTGEVIERPDGSEFQAPIFYRTYKLGVASESNAEGDWHGWNVSRHQALPETGERWQTLLEEAVKFRQALIDGEARGEHAEPEAAGASGGSSDGEGAM